jgi:hypothetical protein
MFSLQAGATRLCDGVSRREWLRVGGLSVLGLSLPQLLRSQAETSAAAAAPVASPLARGLDGSLTFGRAKNVIFVWLQGGPPQHETFDPKPDAPAEIRGLFKPIATNVPGIQFCELLPRTARIADKLAVVRSLHTDDDNHDVSGYWVLTGYPYGPGSARQIKPTDWPYFGSIVKMLKPSERLPALTSVWVPDMMRLNDNVTPAGQTAGFLSKLWEPERFVGDPASPEYQIDGLGLTGEVPRLRVDRRMDLLTQLDRHLARIDSSGALDGWDKLSQNAFDLVTSGKAREAFAVQKEPDKIRERYGRHSWGQTVLLARRLVEAGVRLVHVNWVREPGDTAVDNPMWDTHAQNADRLQDCLCPQFDVGFTALIEDLQSRGLLSETLVVAIGEFGRTPKINRQGGRDHWGRVFSFALAGAGISGGQVFGASDKTGAVPAADPIRPHDLTATIFHLLGIDHQGSFYDRGNRPHLLTNGEPLYRLLGDAPATAARVEPGGDESLVPPYDDSLLVDTAFQSGRLIAAGIETRAKGWRATPLLESTAAVPAGCEFGVAMIKREADGPSRLRHVAIGFGLDAIAPAAVSNAAAAQVATIRVAQGVRAVLAQEIRNARGGHFTFSVRATGGGTSRESFETLLAPNFTCRLVLFRFAEIGKDPRRIQELASVVFRPTFADDGAAVEPSHRFNVAAFLGSTVPGANFAIGNGLGVAVVVEKSSGGELELPGGAAPSAAYIRIHDVSLAFGARPRDDSVVV